MTKTMTAEEVDSDTAAVRRLLLESAKRGSFDQEWAALSRLAAQAARGPGLEQREQLLEQQHARAANLAESRGSELSTLRERVATLEAEVEAAKAEDARQAEIAQRALDARDTAESRVKELEARLANTYQPPTLKEVFGSLDGFLAHARSAARFHGNKEMAKASLLELVVKHIPEADMHTAVGDVEILAAEGPTSQPPPAPAQGVNPDNILGPSLYRRLRKADMRGEQYTLTPEEVMCVVRLAAARAGSPHPAPPPELLEAVGKAVASWDDAGENGGKDTMDALDGAMAALRAAYDATGGRYAKTPEESSDAQGRAARDAATAEDMEDAAKYRAAVERIEKADGDAFFDAYAQAKGDLYVFSRWVLGLTLSTPPSGPGGGEDWPLPPHDRCEMKCMVGKPQECAGPEMAGIRDATSASTAPTPTSSVLAALTTLGRSLRANSGGIHTLVTLEVSGDHFDAASRELSGHEYSRLSSDGSGSIHCETGEVPVRIVRKVTSPTPAPTPPNHSTASNSSPAPSLSHAQESASDSNSPQTPAVLWEGDGVRVLGESLFILTDSSDFPPKKVWAYHGDSRMQQVARALAEAKREMTEMRKAHEAVQYAARNVSWAKAGGEVVAMHSERLRDGAEKAAREAAESMRERAAKMAYASYAGCVRPDCDACRIARVIEGDILSLKLE